MSAIFWRIEEMAFAIYDLNVKCLQTDRFVVLS
jgi:hypothetical protein